jgi:GNAT superfamily N-acetyltransferase
MIDEIEFSPPNPDELPLIFDSWANSFKKSQWSGCVPNHLWDTVSRACITELLERSRVSCAVVSLPAGRRVMGYSVSEPTRRILHWLYVKRDYRGMGIGRRILGDACPDVADLSWAKPWTYTHRTRASSKFLGPAFSWDPVSARVKR